MARRKFWLLPAVAALVAVAVDAKLSSPVWVAGAGWPAMLLAAAAMAVAQFDALGGATTSLRESAAEAWPQAAPLAVLLTAHGLFAAAGQRWIAMEIVNWFLLPWLVLAIPVCVLERRDVWQSVRRGTNLTANHRVASLIILFLPVHFAQRVFTRSQSDWMNGPVAVALYALAAAFCAATLAAFYVTSSRWPAAASAAERPTKET